MTKTKIIQETVGFYSADVTRRSINEKTGRCEYKGPNGKECAFQRCVETNLSEFDKGSSLSAFAIMKEDNDISFKQGYEGYSAEFWNNVQTFHDSHSNWNGDGLSEMGKKSLNTLLELYKN